MTTDIDRSPSRSRLARRWLLRGLALGSLALLIALLAYGVFQNSSNTRIDDNLARARAATAPGFDLPVLQRGDLGPRLSKRLRVALADGRIGLNELRGVPVILNFWASWCAPCRTEAPRLERHWRGERRRGVLLVGLNQQDLTTDARAFMREFHDTYLNVRDEANEVGRRWGVTGLPETFFITAGGHVVSHVIGVISKPQIAAGEAALRTGRPVGALSGGDQRPTQ